MTTTIVAARVFVSLDSVPKPAAGLATSARTTMTAVRWRRSRVSACSGPTFAAVTARGEVISASWISTAVGLPISASRTSAQAAMRWVAPAGPTTTVAAKISAWDATCAECRRPAQTCNDNNDCCDAGMCVNGVCTAACVADGGLCDEHLDCCTDALCLQVTAGQLRCRCSGAGDVCDANSDCCGDGVCVGGRCTAACVAEGGVCDASSTDDCCTAAGNCTQLIAGQWRCRCALDGDVCNANNDCCGDLICNAGSCIERCELSSCTECQTCDPDTGDCFDVDDETVCSFGMCSNGECVRTCPNGNGDCVINVPGDGSLANICCRHVGLSSPVCMPGSLATEDCLCDGNEDCGRSTSGLPRTCCAVSGENTGTCIDNQTRCDFDATCDPATCEGVCCDDTCVAGDCCIDPDCIGAGFADGCGICNLVNHQCETANDGGDCDGATCGICEEGVCIDRRLAQNQLCRESTGQCIFCNAPFGGCGECGVCNQETGRCEMGACPSACETCIRDFASLVPFVCRANCADNPDGQTDCCPDGVGSYACTSFDDDDTQCGGCGVACAGCQFCEGGDCIEDDARCAEAAVCFDGTCEANGECLYIPSTAGASCESVPCGVCDGAGLCLDLCPGQGLLCNAATGSCVECLDAGDCEPCQSCDSGVCFD